MKSINKPICMLKDGMYVKRLPVLAQAASRNSRCQVWPLQHQTPRNARVLGRAAFMNARHANSAGNHLRHINIGGLGVKTSNVHIRRHLLGAVFVVPSLVTSIIPWKLFSCRKLVTVGSPCLRDSGLCRGGRVSCLVQGVCFSAGVASRPLDWRGKMVSGE